MRGIALFLCCVWIGGISWADESNSACALQADVTQLIVDERVTGTAAPEAVPAVRAVLSDDQMIYAPALPALVEWIYALPKEKVGDALAQEYLTQCEQAALN
jgi:hypothetical protein